MGRSWKVSASSKIKGGHFGEKPYLCTQKTALTKNTMKKTVILSGAMLLASALPAAAWQGDVTVETPTLQLLLHAREGQEIGRAHV